MFQQVFCLLFLRQKCLLFLQLPEHFQQALFQAVPVLRRYRQGPAVSCLIFLRCCSKFPSRFLLFLNIISLRRVLCLVYYYSCNYKSPRPHFFFFFFNIFFFFFVKKQSLFFFFFGRFVLLFLLPFPAACVFFF